MLKVGDVVRVKGTTMKMTVNYITSLVIETVWFDANNNLNRDSFSKETLELADDTKKT